MSPILKKNPERTTGPALFVRRGKKIVYDDVGMHKELARGNRDVLGSKTDLCNRPSVHDGGLISVGRRKIKFMGTTSSCQIVSRDRPKARQRTIRVAREITGFEIKSID